MAALLAMVFACVNYALYGSREIIAFPQLRRLRSRKEKKALLIPYFAHFALWLDVLLLCLFLEALYRFVKI